jgi:hypothetical protein
LEICLSSEETKTAHNASQNSKENNGLMLRYSESAVRRAEDVTVSLGFCALMLVPTFLLTYVENKNWKMVVIAVFVLLSTVMSSFIATATHKPGLAVVAG